MRYVVCLVRLSHILPFSALPLVRVQETRGESGVLDFLLFVLPICDIRSSRNPKNPAKPKEILYTQYGCKKVGA